MQILSLEQEFSAYKLAHIVAILKVKLMQYYAVTLANTIQIPSFMGGDTPEKCADRDIRNLYNNDRKRFFELYEEAYKELADKGAI